MLVALYHYFFKWTGFECIALCHAHAQSLDVTQMLNLLFIDQIVFLNVSFIPLQFYGEAPGIASPIGMSYSKTTYTL